MSAEQKVVGVFWSRLVPAGYESWMLLEVFPSWKLNIHTQTSLIETHINSIKQTEQLSVFEKDLFSSAFSTLTLDVHTCV